MREALAGKRSGAIIPSGVANFVCGRLECLCRVRLGRRSTNSTTSIEISNRQSVGQDSSRASNSSNVTQFSGFLSSIRSTLTNSITRIRRRRSCGVTVCHE